MIEFPDQPIGRFDARSGLWVLHEQWVCQFSDGRFLVVDPGARSDGASIPWLLRPFVGPRYNARTFPGAFAHDMLYMAELLPRKQCDREFRRITTHFAGATLAALYYSGVRMGGWYVWRKHTPHSVAQARRYCRIMVAVTGHNR